MWRPKRRVGVGILDVLLSDWHCSLYDGALSFIPKLASGFAVLLIFLGVLVAALSYGLVSDCQNRYSNGNCWAVFPGVGYGYLGGGALGFYLGLLITIVGASILLGGDVARFFGKIRGRGRGK